MYIRSYLILLLASLSMPAIAMDQSPNPSRAPFSQDDPSHDEKLKAFFKGRNRQMTPPPPTKLIEINLQAYFECSGYYSDPGQGSKK